MAVLLLLLQRKKEDLGVELVDLYLQVVAY